MTPAERDHILEYIERYGGTDGAHHKQWVIDQTVRRVLGEVAERRCPRTANAQRAQRYS